MRKKTAFVAVCIIALTCTPSKLVAQLVTYEGCRDIRGIPVASVLNYGLRDVATAALTPGGAPVIIYNPQALAYVKWQTRLFFYAHECGHHALGHTLQSLRLGQEQEADCWGIRTLVRAGKLSDQDIRVIQADISNFGHADWTHLPGPQRAINLRTCLETDDEGSVARPQPERESGSPSDFGDSLHQVIEASATGFRRLRGALDPDSDGEAWVSTLRLAGAQSCEVWIYKNRTLGQRFDCDMARNSDLDAIQPSYDELSGKLSQVLTGWSATAEPDTRLTRRRKVFSRGDDSPTVTLEIYGTGSRPYKLSLFVEPPDRN